MRDAAREHFFPTQLGVAVPGGVEVAIHTVRAWIDRHSGSRKVLIKLDFANAFNSVRRQDVVNATRAHFLWPGLMADPPASGLARRSFLPPLGSNRPAWAVAFCGGHTTSYCGAAQWPGPGALLPRRWGACGRHTSRWGCFGPHPAPCRRAGFAAELAQV